MKALYIISLALILNACGTEQKTEQVALAGIATESTANTEKPVFEIDSSEKIISAMGKIMSPPQGTIEITTGIDANVYNVRVLPGSRVSKGQALAELKNRRIIAIQSDYLKEYYHLGSLEKEYQRKQTLAKDNATSAKELETAYAAFATQKALVQGLEKELQFIGFNPADLVENGVKSSLVLYAPVSGQVEQVMVHEGQFITENQAIITLLDNHRLHVDLEIFAQDAPYVKAGEPVEYSLPGLGKTYQTQIHLVGAYIDPVTNTLSAHGEISNPTAEMKVGMIVSARIAAGKHYRYYLPENQVRFEGEEAYVQVDGQKIPLQIGGFDNERYLILNYANLIKLL